LEVAILNEKNQRLTYDTQSENTRIVYMTLFRI